jgi:hypothetical protein
MSVVLAEEYWAKADECTQLAKVADTPDERERWLKVAERWAALALDANPSGALPWKLSG